MKTESRQLKVENVGDRYRREIKPYIRLRGKWLLEVGIEPYRTVIVSNPKQGTLIIQVKEME